MEQEQTTQQKLHPGQGVTNDRGDLGIITATHYSRGKDKVLVSCGVMWLGDPYEVRSPADKLRPVTLVQAGK